MTQMRLFPPLRRRWPRRTARLRFTALYAGLFLLSGAVLVATTYALFERATQIHQPRLPHVPRLPAIRSSQPPSGSFPSALSRALPDLARAQHSISQAQRQLALSLYSPTGPQVLVPPLAQGQRQLARDQRELVAVQHQLAQAVHEVAHAGTLQAAQRATDSHQLLVDSAIALAIVAVLALLASWFVAGRMLQPIRRITRTARRISSASLHERLALDGPNDELKELGDTLDELFDRLEGAFDAQRRFAANASHELRTPLARQRALIQVALADPQASFESLRAAHERVLVSERHLEQLIDALLTLTRGEAAPERREPLDLAVLTATVLRARETDAADRALEIGATLSAAPASGDPRLVERLIANLLDNAIRHNVPSGRVEIATGTREDRAYVFVANSGQVIAPDDVERLFEPFQRLGDARTRHGESHGLGLSIVSAIATAHGASIIASARAHGGLEVEISFVARAAHEPAPAAARPAGLLALGAGR